ncbi:MAG: hypothetical protein ABSB61_04805 [Anaerolineales bacterium]
MSLAGFAATNTCEATSPRPFHVKVDLGLSTAEDGLTDTATQASRAKTTQMVDTMIITQPVMTVVGRTGLLSWTRLIGWDYP